MDLGWVGLTPAEQQAAIDGGVIGGGSVMAWYAVLGYRRLHRRGKRKRRTSRNRRRAR